MSDIDKALARLLYILVIGLFVFGGAIALGKVQQESSYGLPDILKTIEILAAGVLGILSQGRRNTPPDPPSSNGQPLPK